MPQAVLSAELLWRTASQLSAGRTGNGLEPLFEQNDVRIVVDDLAFAAFIPKRAARRIVASTQHPCLFDPIV